MSVDVVSSPTQPDRAGVIDAVVVSNRAVNTEYRHLRVRAGEPAVSAKAGQFFHLSCPPFQHDHPFLRRPMSVYWIAAQEGVVEFLYKVQGSGTRGLATLRRGDTLNMVGPLGEGFWLDPAWRNIVVVGRGAGLATLAPLATLACASNIGVTAILSARNPELVMSEELFRAAGAQVITVTDAAGTSGPRHVERLMRDLIARARADAFFTCGSNRLMMLLQRLAAEHDIPGQVALEQQMACGLGMCFCCVRDFQVHGAVVQRRVCWDGPVFDLRGALPWSI